MKKSDPKNVTKILPTIRLYEIEGKIEDAITFLQKYMEDNSKYDNIYLEPNTWGDPYEFCIDVTGTRLETPEEVKQRLEVDKAMRAKKRLAKIKGEEQERELYERLKEKYE